MKRKGWTRWPLNLVRHVVPFALLFALPGVSAGVEVGEKAPDFELQSTTGGKIRLSDFAGLTNVVLEFYVLDFNPV